jgi:hypothetical protein
LAVRYLRAVADQDWNVVADSLSPGVIRHGPFGDDFEGLAPYLSFLRRTMPELPGYRMDIDRVTLPDEQRTFVELRETIELEGGPLVTHECLVFAAGPDGRLGEISVYIRQAPPARTN